MKCVTKKKKPAIILFSRAGFPGSPAAGGAPGQEEGAAELLRAAVDGEGGGCEGGSQAAGGGAAGGRAAGGETGLVCPHVGAGGCEGGSQAAGGETGLLCPNVVMERLQE